MIKVCIIIGSRANYSSIKYFMMLLKSDKRFKIQIIANTSSVIDKFGNVANQIEKDGFIINEKIFNLIDGGNEISMTKTTGLALIQIPEILKKLNPNFVLTVGDRYETIATAIASAYMNIPLIHTMGGEITGTIDESIRHAITKFAHIHFTSTQDSKIRVIKLGEQKKNVHNVGCPRIDYVSYILRNKKLSLSELKNGVGNYNYKSGDDFILVSMHPVTTEISKTKKNTQILLDSLNYINENLIILWPNSDAGTDELSKTIRKWREKNPKCKYRLFINLTIETYVHLMNRTNCLVGNSSSGIREGSYIGTPVVNIGSRQNDREKSINVINVPFEKNKIIKAIQRQLINGKYKRSYLYGRGNASHKMIEIISKARVNVQKKLTF